MKDFVMSLRFWKRGRRAPDAVARVRRAVFGTLAVAGLTTLSCQSDFDSTRRAPKRGTVGQELYTLVCDRVGAQSLREDVTGSSYRDICHPRVDGTFASEVDRSLLPPLRPDAKDTEGRRVPLDVQKQGREYNIARVEALGRRRGDLVRAFDATLPDLEIELAKRRTEADSDCDLPATEGKDEYLEQLADTFARFVDLYNDETVPHLTRAMGNLLLELRKDEEAREALARLDARQGYRPGEVALGLSRPALAYPRILDLAGSLLALFSADADPYDPAFITDPNADTLFGNHTPQPGPGNAAFQKLLRVMREELRVPSEADPGPLLIADGADGVPALSRPRTKLEFGKELLLLSHDSLRTGTPRYIVRRDARGVARVNVAGGQLPAPFIDDGTGRPELDALGQFVTTDGQPPPSPFFAVDGVDGQRDARGRALGPAGEPLYEYLDIDATVLRRLVDDLKPLLDPDPVADRETIMKVLGGASLLYGNRAPATATYPPDPDRIAEYAAVGAKAPGNVTDQAITVDYEGFDPTTSPLVDLTYALGQLIARPEIDEALGLFQKLARDRPDVVARLVGLGLRLKAIADDHPEAFIPEQSMFWDNMLSVFEKIVKKPNMLEALIRAFADPRTEQLGPVFAAYMQYRDQLTYNRDPNQPENLDIFNGPLFNLTRSQGTSGSLAWGQPSTSTPVDRSQPDSGANRSVLQRFLQLLHDANGLAVCTKQNAVAHLEIEWPQNSGIRINLDFPTDFLVQAVCGVVGGSIPPNPMPQCGILRFENVAELIVDVAVERAEFDIRDPCLRNLMNSPLTGLVGGADAFLQDVSGIDGFKLQPTVGAIARMAFFDTPYTQFGGYAGTQFYPKPRDFLGDIIDPVPTTVCPVVPFTDTDGKVLNLRQCGRFEDTMRGRDSNALFPLQEMGFVDSIRPLALSFADNDGSLLFVELFDTMHIHWGSPDQTLDECDPNAPRDNGRWCTRDGVVRYEPLLAEMVTEANLLPEIAEIVRIIDTPEYDGVRILSEAVRVLVDPAKNQGLSDRFGRREAVLNDGSTRPQITPVYLLIDSLKAIDARFAQYATDTGDFDRQKDWRQARSQLVDTFFTVQGNGTATRFENPAVTQLLPRALGVVREQTRAHCPNLNSPSGCPWAEQELSAKLSEVLSGPTFATIIDVLEAIRTDPAARRELQLLATYLLDQASSNDAFATTLSSAADMFQVLADEKNLDPVYRMLSRAMAPTIEREDGSIARRGTVDALLEVLTRIFARGYTDDGKRLCTSALDPHETIAVLLNQLVTPIGENEPAPIEILFSVIADVNRADPRSSEKYDAEDYDNLSREVSDFFLDEGSGLEQVYTLIRQATIGD